MNLSKRELLIAGAASLVAGAAPALAQPLLHLPGEALMPRDPKRRRVVVCGGGWGGMTAAKYIRQAAPDLEVVLLERNPIFWSCPMSNKWLIDAIDTGFLVHDYMTPARNHGYTFVQCEITGIDRGQRRVHTTKGTLDYDWIVISAGIRYGFEPWFGNDRRAIEFTKTNFASAYIPSAEHLLLKRRIQEFKGGTLVMTLPPPPHRCPPSPYERAALIAWWFKKHQVPAKIVILDPKPRIAPISKGFKDAFEELYPDIIQHVPNATVREVDPFNKVIRTAAGDFRFDDAILMGHHQAADLVWQAGLIGKTPEGKPTAWADVHPLYYHAKDDPRTFVIGDSVGAVSPKFGHYPKSGHVANRMARSVAQYIAAQANDRPLSPVIIDNLCYMLVNNDPREAISVQFDYRIGADGLLEQTQIDYNDRDPALFAEDVRWAATMYADFAR